MNATHGSLRLFIGSMVLCAGCATVPRGTFVVPPGDPRQVVVETARGFIGARQVDVDGRRFPRDCSGFVRAVYLRALGIDIFRVHPLPRGANGVRIIYQYCRDNGRIHTARTPREGDIVFFNNTHDLNRNGRLDDPLTHVGIVESVDRAGTITFIHRSSSRGIVRDTMNLYHPNSYRLGDRKEVVNSPLRQVRSPADRRPYLAGQLFDSFGSVFR